MMPLLGWCQTGHHEGRETKNGTTCPGIVGGHGNLLHVCDCPCHGGKRAEATLPETDLDPAGELVPV